MKSNKGNSILLIILIILILVSIYLNLSERGVLEVRLRSSIAEVNEKIDKLEYTAPIKGVDYHDGVDGRDGVNGRDGEHGADGRDGRDSISTHTVETIIREIPVNGRDGLTPIIRCNTDRNRWEISYIETKSWVIMKSQNGDAVKCIGGVE